MLDEDEVPVVPEVEEGVEVDDEEEPTPEDLENPSVEGEVTN